MVGFVEIKIVHAATTILNQQCIINIDEIICTK